MNRQISPTDWQKLSDYLDRQLSPKDTQDLQTELSTQPELKQALDDLRITRLMLNKLPRRRAPKNFTLSPASLPRRASIFPFAPAFGLASALCTILLLLSFLFQTTLTSQPPHENNLALQSKAGAPMAAEANTTGPTPEGATFCVSCW